MPKAPENSELKTIRSIERAMDVLACFDPQTPQQSVTELQKRTELSRPTLYRILATLQGKGVIRSFGNPQRFELGHEATRLAANWIGQDDFIRAAGPALRGLWEKTGETVALFVATDDGMKICIEEIRSQQPLTFTRGIGLREDLEVGASGKAILAFMEDGKTDPDLDDVRRNGVRISEGEVIDGAVAIAAPVFARDGNVKASVCLFGPEVRMADQGRRSASVELVRAASEEISHALGYFPAHAAE